MPNQLVKRQPSFGECDYDDGFNDASSSRPTSRGSFLRWTEQVDWVDRDSVAPPSPLLVWGIDEKVRRWRTIDGIKQPEDITEKPLPDPEDLNQTTPESEWERQLDGSVGDEVFVYLVDLGTGERYTYSNSTAGAHIAWDVLREAVITMRALRGEKCYPLVNLTKRPMKSKWRPNGMGMRPHFEIVDWKTPGDGNAVPAPSPAPQLTAPAAAPTPAAPTPTSPPPAPPPAPPAQSRRAKPAVPLSEYTRAVMGDVKPVSVEEELNDTLPF
jgi:hypothetical protein